MCVSTFGRELLKDYKPPCRSLTTPFVHHHHYRQYRRRRRSFGFLLLIFPVCRNAPADPLAPAIQPYCPGGDGWAVKRANCVDDGAICDETIILWATSVCVCVCILTAVVLSFPRPVRSPECVFPGLFRLRTHVFSTRYYYCACLCYIRRRKY